LKIRASANSSKRVCDIYPSHSPALKLAIEDLKENKD
jgi:hypothetical protein